MTNFSGKRVLVTGASRGAGAGIAKAFAKAGATVVLAARSGGKLEQLKDYIETNGGRAQVEIADLSSREGARDLARRCGEIDILINNAALTAMKYQSVATRDDDFWDTTFMTGLFAPIALIQELSPGMVKRGHGVILNISSTAGQRGCPDLAPYAAMKSALDTMSKVAAIEFASERTGVRVNSVAFGFIDTEGLAQNCGGRDGAVEVARQLSPLGRLITVEEVADLCVYLASDSAAPILGAVIDINGGQVAGDYTYKGRFTESEDRPER